MEEEKKGSGHCSGLHPSEKELPEWRSITKIPLDITYDQNNINNSSQIPKYM
jgi:hypothetical protein